MASKTEICNMALKHLGAKTCTDVETENSAEAIVCRIFFDIGKDAFLGMAEWPFATKQATLALVSEDPTTEWEFSYQYPSDCLQFIGIVNEFTNYQVFTNVNRTFFAEDVPCVVVYGTSGREIYTNREDAIGKYIVRITETGRFPDVFTLAFSYFLATLLAPSLVGIDNPQLTALVNGLSVQWREMAAAFSFREETVIHQDQNELLTSRMI